MVKKKTVGYVAGAAGVTLALGALIAICVVNGGGGATAKRIFIAPFLGGDIDIPRNLDSVLGKTNIALDVLIGVGVLLALVAVMYLKHVKKNNTENEPFIAPTP